MWSNRWSSMPLPIVGFESLPAPDQRAWLDTMPGSEVPVIRQPFEPGDRLPIFSAPNAVGQHHLYDLTVDPHEQENRVGGQQEAGMIELLREALAEVDAPAEHLARLGI
jgi:hypothetical protein